MARRLDIGLELHLDTVDLGLHYRTANTKVPFEVCKMHNHLDNSLAMLHWMLQSTDIDGDKGETTLDKEDASKARA